MMSDTSLDRRQEWVAASREMLTRSIAEGFRPSMLGKIVADGPRRYVPLPDGSKSVPTCRRGYWAQYHKRRQETDPEYRAKARERAKRYWHEVKALRAAERKAARTAETPEQRRERLYRKKVRKVLGYFP